MISRDEKHVTGTSTSRLSRSGPRGRFRFHREVKDAGTLHLDAFAFQDIDVLRNAIVYVTDMIEIVWIVAERGLFDTVFRFDRNFISRCLDLTIR